MNPASLPTIRRARGWRLYGLDGSRYIDLYSDGGRCILGRKNGGIGSLAKACLDQGLVSEFPSIWTARFIKALLEWQQGYDKAFLFPSQEQARAALAAAPGLVAGVRIKKAYGEFLKNEESHEMPDPSNRLAFVDLPLPSLWSFGIVLASGHIGEAVSGKLSELSAAHSIPALKMALATRAISELAAFGSEYNETLWARIDPYIEGLFTRSGPWLYPDYEEPLHSLVFSKSLDAGILISPDFCQPSIVPGEFEPGELRGLKLISAAAREASR